MSKDEINAVTLTLLMDARSLAEKLESHQRIARRAAAGIDSPGALPPIDHDLDMLSYAIEQAALKGREVAMWLANPYKE